MVIAIHETIVNKKKMKVCTETEVFKYVLHILPIIFIKKKNKVLFIGLFFVHTGH